MKYICSSWLSEGNLQAMLTPIQRTAASGKDDLALTLSAHGGDGDERAARVIYNETLFLFFCAVPSPEI